MCVAETDGDFSIPYTAVSDNLWHEFSVDKDNAKTVTFLTSSRKTCLQKFEEFAGHSPYVIQYTI